MVAVAPLCRSGSRRSSSCRTSRRTTTRAASIVHAMRDVDLIDRARRVRRHRRHERVGQVDDDEHPRLPRSAHARDLHARRDRRRQPRGRLARHRAKPRHRLHLPGVQPAVAHDRARERASCPLQYRGVSARERRRRATAALEAVGLGDRIDHTPNQLSGGQQQRVAIARALVTDPPLLLADEPTGNLDTRTSLEVLALLQQLNRDRGITIVLVTHERDIAACASRVVTMRDGRIVSDVVQDEPLDAAAELAALPRADDGAAPGAHKSDARELAAARVGGPVPFGVFAMMALGAVLGLAAGSSYVGLVLGLSAAKYAWCSLASAEVGQAWLGARWARRRRVTRPPTISACASRFWYSIVELGLVGVAIFLALRPGTMGSQRSWLDGAFALLTERLGGGLAARSSAMVFVSVCFTVLLRYLLLTACEPRRRVSGSATDDDDELFASWGSFARYPAMLGGHGRPGSSSASRSTRPSGARSLWIPLRRAAWSSRRSSGAATAPRATGVSLDASASAPGVSVDVLARARGAVRCRSLVWIAASHAARRAGWASGTPS